MQYNRDEVFAISVCHHRHFNTTTPKQRAAPVHTIKNLMGTKKPVFKPFSCQRRFQFDIWQKAETIQAKWGLIFQQCYEQFLLTCALKTLWSSSCQILTLNMYPHVIHFIKYNLDCTTSVLHKKDAEITWNERFCFSWDNYVHKNEGRSKSSHWGWNLDLPVWPREQIKSKQ